MNGPPPKETRSWPLLRRLLFDFVRPHARRVAVAFALMIVGAATTAGLANLMEPMMNQVFQGNQRALILPVAFAAFGALTLRGLATFGHSVIMNRVGLSVIADLQRLLFRRFVTGDIAFFQGQPAGVLVSRMISDMQALRSASVEALTGIVKSTLTLIFLVGVMVYQDWRLAIATLVLMPSGAFITARIGRLLRKLSKRTQEEMGGFVSVLNEVFQGVRQVKAYGMEAHEARRVDARITALLTLRHKAFRMSALSTPLGDALAGLAILAVIIYGGNRVIDGAVTVGALFAFVTALLLAYEPLKRLGRVYGQMQTGLAAAERVFGAIDHAPEIRDRPNAATLHVRAPDITFEGVHLDYAEGTKALRAIDLTLPGGKTTALVGPSGAGKSSLMNLVPRFYDPSAGAVRVAGMDVRDVTQASLRRAIAYVSQEAAVFDATVRENIAYGRPGAAEEEIIAAAKGAAAHDFIEALPQGYDTAVGEWGTRLSGGQRQRIAIARAMLRDAPILLLDEATSSLDVESERAVQEALRRLREGRTTVIVAHRFSTIRDADLVVVLDHGRVVEQGTYEKLIAERSGLFAKLALSQLGGDVITLDAYRAAGS